MQSESRTAKSIKNSSIGLIFYFIKLVLQFFSRKIFLDYLGTEILGLNTTATNLLQVLNLAELGVGSAVGFSLYKPFYDKDEQTINEIVALQGKLYRRIAYIVIAGSALLMCFFPWIFAKMPLPLWYAYASFGVLLFSNLLGYFVNYKQILLSADQKSYKIQYSYKSVVLVKTLFQILVIRYWGNGYIWWLILEVVFAVLAAFSLSRTVTRTYPFLTSCTMSLKELNEKYPAILTKIRQVFFHKIAGVALAQISPIIIYAFASLSLVAIYGNYMLIVTGLIYFASTIFIKGQTASVGNLVAEEKNERIMSVFEELFSVQFLMACIMSFGMMALAQPFIALWVGKEFLLSTSTLSIITAILFIGVSRQTVDTYLSAHGFFSDIWAPVIEATLNIGLSILLGYFYGLNGILSGVLISLIVIVWGWKPLFLFHIKLKHGLLRYIIIYIKHLLIASVATGITYLFLQILSIDPYAGFGQFFLYGIASLVTLSLLLAVLLYMTHCGFRNFCKRFIKS